jgi:hypothetical protein
VVEIQELLKVSGIEFTPPSEKGKFAGFRPKKMWLCRAARIWCSTFDRSAFLIAGRCKDPRSVCFGHSLSAIA